MKFRKKPVVIEARQMLGTNAETHAVYQWVEENTLGSFDCLPIIEGEPDATWPESGVSIDPRDGRMVIATLEGGHWVNLGDWVIRGIQGEFYPCKSAIFDATYEPAQEDEMTADPKSVTVTIRPTISDEFIQAMRQVAEAFNEVADRMAELNDDLDAASATQEADQ